MRLISVVVGAPNSKTRFNESATLLNYGFTNFVSEKLVDSGVAIKTLPVFKGKVESVEAFASEDFARVVKKGSQSGYEISIETAERVKAPTKAGDVVGNAVVTKNGEVIKTIPIVVKEDIKHLSLFETAKEIAGRW